MMNVQEFGERLVRTGDLDPVYLVLRNSSLDAVQREQWCMGYWLFYHAGVASQLASQDPGRFWDTAASILPTAPRGTERRHFRGRFAVRTVEWLGEHYQHPSDAVFAGILQPVQGAGWHRRSPLPAELVRKSVERWHGFGPWVSFKVADMVDAVLGHPVDFSASTETLFDSPRQAAMQLYREWHPEEPLRKDVVGYVIHRLSMVLGKLTAPHCPQRPLAVQEYETILCKYKSHLTGHYPMGKDSRELMYVLRHSGWGGDLAGHLYESGTRCLDPR